MPERTVVLTPDHEDIIDALVRSGRYEALLIAALRDVAAVPDRPGSMARPELGDGVRSYHLRHSRTRARSSQGIVRQPRHLLPYRAILLDRIGIGRVLHDSMEIELHLPSRYGDE